jgi:hypothetical protein
MLVKSLKLDALEERQALERLFVLYLSFQDYIQALTPVVKGESFTTEFFVAQERFRLKFAEYETLFCEWHEGEQNINEAIGVSPVFKQALDNQARRLSSRLLMLLMLKVATLTKPLSVPAAAGFAATNPSHHPASRCTKALQGLRIDPRRLMSKLLHVFNV